MLRELSKDEIPGLEVCLAALAAHHNQVSVFFKGSYPNTAYSETLGRFAEQVASGVSRIAVAEEAGEMAGFCKIDLTDGKGKLDYLLVLERFRGKGYGKQLMDWAMGAFRDGGAGSIEVKVVDGNDAIRLYEAYGFRMNAHILKYTC